MITKEFESFLRDLTEYSSPKNSKEAKKEMEK
jgi:hypothetical protein